MAEMSIAYIARGLDPAHAMAVVLAIGDHVLCRVCSMTVCMMCWSSLGGSFLIHHDQPSMFRDTEDIFPTRRFLLIGLPNVLHWKDDSYDGSDGAAIDQM